MDSTLGCPLVGLASKARNGKDTVAHRLTEQYGFVRIGFIDPVQNGLEAMLGVSLPDDGPAKEAPLEGALARLNVSPRRLKQTLGSEWGRDLIHPEIWIVLAEIRARAEAAKGCAGIVISDVRMEDEANWVRSLGGSIWHLRRPGATPVAAHRTENGIQARPGDEHILNNGTLDELHRQVDGLHQKLVGLDRSMTAPNRAHAALFSHG